MLEAKFPDPWDTEFSNNIKQILLAKKSDEIADSPWNIGFFIDNELHWFNAAVYTRIITSAPAEQPPHARAANIDTACRATAGRISRHWCRRQPARA